MYNYFKTQHAVQVCTHFQLLRYIIQVMRAYVQWPWVRVSSTLDCVHSRLLNL